MAYYGLAMNPNFLGGDRYASFIIGAFLEIPALLIVLFTMNTLGRKTLCMGGFLAAALCLLITMPFPKSKVHFYLGLLVCTFLYFAYFSLRNVEDDPRRFG